MRGVFLDFDSLNPADLDLTALRTCLTDWDFHHLSTPDQVAARISTAQIVVTNKVPLDSALIESAPDLKLICVAATGTDNVDLTAARDAGVVVSNARDYATASVVEHVFMLMFTLTRRLDDYRDRTRRGDWTGSPHFCLFDSTINELAGKTLGVVGYGVLGQAVARMAEAFSMRVSIAQRLHGEPLPDRVPLQQLLETADIVSLHCPLTEQTRGLIGARELQSMKADAILINTARGGIVAEKDLLQALKEESIAGAALDVLEQEPPPASHPLVQYAAASSRLILTPHIAWASRPARQRLVNEILANISAFMAGEPRNRVA
ncbi:MAG: D-2-hydroxyacid dehydrogenase [Thiogranum sp.]|nr:D-2-hydroxyacid dehydrogenase [Thiogranum sp.]